jgi:hypothetical protein
MGVATVDELLRLGREALAAADWESGRAFFEQAAEFGESAATLAGLGDAYVARGCVIGASVVAGQRRRRATPPRRVEHGPRSCDLVGSNER